MFFSITLDKTECKGMPFSTNENLKEKFQAERYLHGHTRSPH